MTLHAQEQTIRRSVREKAIAALLAAGSRGLTTDEVCRLAGSHAAPRRLWEAQKTHIIRKEWRGPDRWTWYCDGERVPEQEALPLEVA